MAVTTATSSSRRANQFYEVTNIEGQDAILFYSNKDNILIPCDSDGTNPVYTGASITLSLFEGGKDVTSDWTIIVYSVSNVTGTFSSNIYSVTSLFADIGTITFRASKEGYSNIYKEVKVYKVKAGAAGTNGNFCYIAFADDKEGTGFTTTFSEKEYYAILPSSTEVTSLDVTDFAGLWRPFYNYPEVPSYNNYSVLHTDFCAWNALGMSHVAFRPQSYYYKGVYNRLYFVTYSYRRDALSTVRSAPGNLTWTAVWYYDLDNNYFSDYTLITHNYPTSTDGHDQSSLIVTDDGYILIGREQLQPSLVHNSPIDIYRSDNPEDISSFSLITTLTNPGSDGYCYPNIIKNQTEDKLHILLRGNGGRDHGHLCYANSTDNGLTWSNLDSTSDITSEIAYCTNIVGSGLDWYFYTNMLKGSRENGIGIIGVLNEGPNGTSPDGTLADSRNKFLMYLYTSDGITWGNSSYQHGLSGSFSKNILTSGPITPNELLVNCLIVRCDTTPYVSYTVRETSMGTDGTPYVLYSIVNRYDSALNPDYSTKDNVSIGTYISYFDTSTNSWITNDISGIEKERNDIDSSVYSYTSFRPVMNVFSNGALDIILHKVISKTDPYKTDIVIEDGSDLIGGNVYRINTLGTPNSFGEGLIEGDYFNYTNSTYSVNVNASNTLIPLESKIYFLRSYDKGLTWTEVREPLEIFKYSTANPIAACSTNIIDSGKVAIFLGVPEGLTAGTTLEHSNLVLITDEIKPYIS